MRPLLARFIALVMMLLPSSCGVRDTAYNPSHFHVTGPIVPPDVVMPRGATGGSAVDGLHIGRGDGPTEDLCCWIDTRVMLSVAKGPGQRTLRVGTYIPKGEQFERHPQRLTVHFPNGDVVQLPALGPGMHVTSVGIPKALVALKGPLELRIIASARWLPPDLPSSHYAALLVSITFV